MNVIRQSVCISAALLVLSACGQSGPLYLPGEARDIVTRPAAPPPADPKTNPGDTTERSNSPETVDTPVPNPPAPEVTAPDATTPKKKDGTTPPK